MLALLLPLLAWAEPPVDPFEQSWELLTTLEASGYPDIAASEVLRALQAHQDHEAAPSVRLRLSRFQREHGHWLAEEQTLLQGRSAHPEWAPWFELALLDTHLQRQDWASLAEAAEDESTEAPVVVDAVTYYEAWSLVGLERPSEAVAALSRVQGPLRPDARALAGDLAGWDQIRHRSPGTAAALSILPGAGHLYSGRPGAALLSALTVGGMGAGTAILVLDERYWTGGLLAALTLSLWSSALADAATSARAFNGAQRAGRLQRLQADHWISAELTQSADEPLLVENASPDLGLVDDMR